MKNCPLTGNPCPSDKVFTISEHVREFVYTTDCCRSCVQDYIRLRNESAASEAAQLAVMDAELAEQQVQSPPPSQHQGVVDLLGLMGIDISMLKKPLVVEKIGTVKQVPAEVKRCPGCECSLQDLRKMKKMGCPECYNTFAAELESYVPKVQGGQKKHKGKSVTPAEPLVPEVKLPNEKTTLVAILREQMAQAVAEEDYEKAGACRDLIKKYGGDVEEENA